MSVIVRHKYVTFHLVTLQGTVCFIAPVSVFTSDQLHLITNCYITSNSRMEVRPSVTNTSIQEICAFHFILHEQLISG